MAEVLFGRHERGRPKGTKTWTEEKYLELAEAASALWKKNQKLRDAKIAKLLSEGGAFKDYGAESIRQRMGEARRIARERFEEMWAEDDL